MDVDADRERQERVVELFHRAWRAVGQAAGRDRRTTWDRWRYRLAGNDHHKPPEAEVRSALIDLASHADLDAADIVALRDEIEHNWKLARDLALLALASVPDRAAWAGTARLRALVDASGLGRGELATQSGLTRAGLHKALSEAGNPTAVVIERILLAIGRKWGDLDRRGE